MGTKDAKEVWLNEKLVGEAPATGVVDRDAEAIIQFLKDKGLYKETSPVRRMFRQAMSFATTSAYLYKRDLIKVPKNGLSVAPFVVNGAFAIELYLKTLGRLHDVDMRGHDLCAV